MKYLDLYPVPENAPLEITRPTLPNQSCCLCPLSASAKAVCLPPEGDPGGLLIVGDHPRSGDDARGRNFTERDGRKFRSLVRSFWDGPVCYDNALKCFPSGKNVTDRFIKICRTYLAQTLQDVKPQRIIAVGALAMRSVLGRSAPSLAVRRGYGWLEKTGTPVFCLMDPHESLENRVLGKWLADDLQWALTVDIGTLQEQSSRDGCAVLIQTEGEAKRAVWKLRAAEWVAYDTETVGLLFNDDFEVISIAVTGTGFEDSFVWSGEVLENAKIVGPLLDLLIDPDQKLVAQNAKYDANAMYSSFGVSVNSPHLDTCLLRKIFEPESSAKLSVMQELVGMGGGKEIAESAITQIVKQISKAKSQTDLADIGPIAWVTPIADKTTSPGAYAYGLIDSDIRDRYCARDAVSTARLAELFQERLRDSESLTTVWEEIMRPTAGAIEHVERWGVGVDRNMIREFRETATDSLTEVTGRLQAAETWNINSTSEVQRFLYERHKFPVVRKTQSGKPSTDKATLEALRKNKLTDAQKQILDDMLDYRRLSKLLSTYANRFESFIRDDGRVHPSFNLTGARSGRISCSNPNVQQVPRASTKLGAMARNCFAAPPGKILIQLDYSQLELRVAAMLSGDSAMIEVFRSGKDYHLRTAQLIAKIAWGIDESEVTKTHRTAAKAVNFGLLYGKSVSSLAKDMNCSLQEAQRIQSAIYGSFPKLKRWCDEQLRVARTEGYTYTYWGNKRARLRPMFRIADKDEYVRSIAEHGSWNTPIQGTASDLCLASLARCVGYILKDKIPVKLILTVHDSLLFETDESFAGECEVIMRHLMTSWDTNGVPITVDGEIGYAWGSLKELES